jgi:hypothetical protein
MTEKNGRDAASLWPFPSLTYRPFPSISTLEKRVPVRPVRGFLLQLLLEAASRTSGTDQDRGKKAKPRRRKAREEGSVP